MCNCKKKKLGQTIVDGAIGLTKTVLQLDQADKETIEARRKHCRDCEHSTRNWNNKLYTLSICKICKCNIKAKTAIQSEECPLLPPKWKKIELPQVEENKEVKENPTVD